MEGRGVGGGELVGEGVFVIDVWVEVWVEVWGWVLVVWVGVERLVLVLILVRSLIWVVCLALGERVLLLC